jgi:hypothetical protein
MSLLKNGPGTRRRVTLAFYAIFLTAAVLATAFMAWLIPWGGSRAMPDRLAETGDFLAGGTLALALIAGIVALHAFAAATGLPELQFQIIFPFSHPNRPIFRAEHNLQGNLQIAAPLKQAYPAIRVQNTSGYSARNPAVIIRLQGMAFKPSSERQGWDEIDFVPQAGVTAVQWDGGDHSVHGNSERRLPPLALTELAALPPLGELILRIELLADGYRRHIEMPVRLLAEHGEWEQAISAPDDPTPWL